MRLVLTFLAVLCTAGTMAQLNKPPQFFRMRYAADTMLRKPAPLKTAQPRILERMQRTTSECNVLCSPLPVKFLSLKAERKSEDRVVVQWETANELNVHGYEVERSLGDAHHFVKSGFLAVAGEANPFPTYVFPDANDFSGTSYYRIKQLDKDGKYSYSKTVSVKGFSRTEGLEAHPNPARNELQLTLTVTKSGPVVLHLLDVTGRIIGQYNRVLAKGGNAFSLSVTSLALGTYFLRTVTPSEKTVSIPFVKQ